MKTTHIQEVLQSKKFKKIIGIFCLAILALIIFSVGMEVGYMKAEFSYKFGESYYRSFGPNGMHPVGFVPGDVSLAHGVTGKIITIELPTFVMTDTDSTEKIVRITDDTIIRKLRETMSADSLTVGDEIILLGTPDTKAEIEAKLIRIIPQQ